MQHYNVVRTTQTNCSKWTVYKHTSPSGKVYIGITSRKPHVRWNNGKGYVGNDYFIKAIEKYGWDNFEHEILYENLTKEIAEAKEIELIAMYNSTDRECGYNISSGGCAPSLGLRWKLSDEVRQKRSGKKHWMYGKHLTDEQKKHLSKLNSGHRHPQYGTHRSEETKRKIAEKQRCKKLTDEQKKQISESLKGNIPVNRKKVRCVETGEVFESIESAKRIFGITCIWKALQDSNRTAGGFHWEYV